MFNNKIYITLYVLCVCRGVGIVLVEAQGQHAGVSSLLPPCVFMDQTSVARPGKQVPSPTEPSYRSPEHPCTLYASYAISSLGGLFFREAFYSLLIKFLSLMKLLVCHVHHLIKFQNCVHACAHTHLMPFCGS